MFCYKFSPRPHSCDCRRPAINWVGKKCAPLQGEPPRTHVSLWKGVLSMMFQKISIILLTYGGILEKAAFPKCMFLFQEAARVTVLSGYV